MWGVGSNKLKLPIPNSAPEGIKLLLEQCLSIKPRNRPSFAQIIKHLDVVSNNETLLKLEEEYHKNQMRWRQEVAEKLSSSKNENLRIQVYNYEDDLVQKRKEELKHATDIRELYEQKLEKANNLYMELNTVLLQLDERERELLKRERAFDIHNKKVVRPILRREFQSFNDNLINNNKPSKSKPSTTAIETRNGETETRKEEQHIVVNLIDLTELYYKSYLYKTTSSMRRGLGGKEETLEMRSALGQRRFRSSKIFKNKTKMMINLNLGQKCLYNNVSFIEALAQQDAAINAIGDNKKIATSKEHNMNHNRSHIYMIGASAIKRGKEVVGLFRKKFKIRVKHYLDSSLHVWL